MLPDDLLDAVVAVVLPERTRDWNVLSERLAGAAIRQARIARYRQHAAEIRAIAKNTKGQIVRKQLLEIARQYEALATSIEWLPLPRDDREP